MFALKVKGIVAKLEGEFMETVESVVKRLSTMADPANSKGLDRYNIPSQNALGIKMPQLRQLAKTMGRNHQLAQQLWKLPIHEAKILASLLADPKQMTWAEADEWVAAIYSWDVCDQCCINVFIYIEGWKDKLLEWIRCEAEFTKRAGIVMAAMAPVHQPKKTSDEELVGWLGEVEKIADDPRNYVKKAVSWAFRQAAKKRPHLKSGIEATAGRLAASPDKTRRWIGLDVMRELKKL